MWKYTDKLNSEVITGNRQEFAEYLNIHGDIYDDAFWYGVIKIHRLEEVVE